MASGGVKVLSSWYSVFGVRVVMALHEKGVEYEYEEEDLLNKSQRLLDSNPVHKKVPVLIHNGKPICESLIILQYIDETWPAAAAHALLPEAPFQRALARFWADYADQMLHEACVLILKNVEGESMEKGRTMVKEALKMLDGALQDVSGGGPFFGGKQVNLVDLTLASYICWFMTLETLANFKVLDEDSCPHLLEWAKLVVEHPSVKEGLATTPSHKVLEKAKFHRKTVFGLAD